MLATSRLKGWLIAVVVLALSAGVALGADALPTAAESGLDRAATASGQDVPVGRQSDPAPEADEDGDEDGDEDEPVLEEPSPEEDGGDADATLEEAWDNHGDMVSEAAHMDTPEGFRNHGHWVSCVAHMDSSEWVDLSTLTPEDCDGLEDEESPEEEPPEEEPLEEEPSEDVVEESWDNHGDMVSEAAHMDTPEGFRNHGHFVSCVAQMDEAEWMDLSTLTAEDCSAEATDEAEAEAGDAEAASDADKGKGKDKARNQDGGKNKSQDKSRGKGRGRNR